MADLIGWGVGLTLIGVIIWATVAVAGGGGRTAAKRRGGLQMMAAMLFGFGAVLDPPQRHVAAAGDKARKGSPESGEPELDD